MRDQKRDNKGFITILYAFSFLLLWEWIRPLKTITDTGNANLFVLFIFISFVLYIFHIRKEIDIVLKFVFIMFSLHHLYHKESIFRFSWIHDFLSGLTHNMKQLFAGNWDLLSGEFRSLLFFILLWLITYLLKYWITVRRNIFIFFVMTILYITILDTFTPYHGEWPIVRTMIVGLAVLGILYFKRLSEQNRVANSKNNWVWWIVPLTVMISGCTLFALCVPKANALWPDPVPYIQAHVGKDKQHNGKGSGGLSTVGFREDDSRLGGPFQGDNKVVFRVKAPSRQYWRVETRDTYTGKGWVNTVNVPTDVFASGYPAFTSVRSYQNEIQKRNTADIHFNRKSQIIVYPYGLQTISDKSGLEKFVNNATTDKVTLFNQDPNHGITDYKVIYNVPQYSIKELKKDQTAVDVSMLTTLTPFLQLPDTLPQRVRDLAEKITKGKDNQYDKAKAIEQYFQMNGFVYDQKNVAIPKNNEDYVDQFLFETKRGYCDNFSTSMVTLLREVGIPSRWVKGFSGGDYVDTVDDNNKLYDVTNNNAHSWVEVLFPTVGWVPFEPTIGFSNNAIFRDDESKVVNSTSPEEDMQKNQPKKNPKQEVSQDDTPTTEKFSLKVEWKKAMDYIKLHWLRFIIIFVLILFAIGYIYLKRSKWLPYYLVFHYRKKDTPDTFSRAYLSLLKQLDRYGIQKQNGQTLREFAKYVDSFFETTAMRQLTEHYERIIYRGLDTGVKWEETRELWENLIKKTSS